MGYTGFEITEADRTLLLSHFPAKFPDFIGHHVTWEFGVDEHVELPSADNKLTVVGYCADDSLECLVVEYDNYLFRPDRGLLHLTWSLDRSKGRKPVHSNDVLKTNPVDLNVPKVSLTVVPKFFK